MMMIVDAHTHIWNADSTFENPSATIVSPLSEIPATLLSAYMDEFGVDRAVFVQPIYPGDDNSLVADCAAAEPDRFAAVCVVDPNSADAPNRLEYWVRERGCKGLRLRPVLPAESNVFGSPQGDALWQRAEELNIAINVLARQMHIEKIGVLAERFPRVPIIIDHVAHPDVTSGVQGNEFQALLSLARFENVSIKPTGHYYYSQELFPYADCDAIFHALAEHFGPSRLIWGSDFPHVLLKTGYRRSLNLVERNFSFLSEADLRFIFGENSLRLYW